MVTNILETPASLIFKEECLMIEAIFSQKLMLPPVGLHAVITQNVI